MGRETFTARQAPGGPSMATSTGCGLPPSNNARGGAGNDFPAGEGVRAPRGCGEFVAFQPPRNTDPLNLRWQMSDTSKRKMSDMSDKCPINVHYLSGPVIVSGVPGRQPG
jgi:hypothetical protein